MKRSMQILLIALSCAVTAGADLVTITNITPTKTGTNVTASASNGGGVYTDRSPGFNVGTVPSTNTMASDYYGITVTNLTIGGVSNVTLTFDLNLSVLTNATVKGIGVRSSGNNTFAYWTDVNGNNFSRYFDSSAVLTFVVTNVTIDHGLTVSSITFRNDQPWGVYSNIATDVVSSDPQYIPTWNPATGTLTAAAVQNASVGAVVKGLGIDFTVIPEPATVGMLGGGCILLLVLRRLKR